MKRNIKTKHKTYFVNVCSCPYDNFNLGGATIEADNPNEVIIKFLKKIDYQDFVISTFSYTKDNVTYARVVYDMSWSDWALADPYYEKNKYWAHWFKIWE